MVFIGRLARGDERPIKLGVRQLQSYSGVNLTSKRWWYPMQFLQTRIVALCNGDSLSVETNFKKAISATRNVSQWNSTLCSTSILLSYNLTLDYLISRSLSNWTHERSLIPFNECRNKNRAFAIEFRRCEINWARKMKFFTWKRTFFRRRTIRRRMCTYNIIHRKLFRTLRSIFSCNYFERFHFQPVMLNIRGETTIMSQRVACSSSAIWYFLTVEFLIGALLSGLLAFLTVLKSLLPKPPRDLTGDVVLVRSSFTPSREAPFGHSTFVILLSNDVVAN